jgi:hypothetical protein
MHAVLCKRQLQPWSVDTGRLLCVWLPLLYILLLDCGPSRWSGSRVSLASCLCSCSYPSAPQLSLGRFSLLSSRDLGLLDSGRGQCSADIGWCVRLRFLQASRCVVLDDSFVLVILGRKPKSEQEQGEGVHGRRGAEPWKPGARSQRPCCRHLNSWLASVTDPSPSPEGIDTIKYRDSSPSLHTSFAS